MKKLLAIILSAMMVSAMSVSAFAATELGESPANGNDEGEYTIGVNGKFVPGAAADTEVSVDISWEAMDFTYTAGDSSYNSTTHVTTYGDGSWSTNKPGITVTNNSNIAVDAAMSFTATASGVIGTFYTMEGEDNYTAITSDDDLKISLESAEGKGIAPEGTRYFGISGDAIDSDTALGTITVVLSTEKWTTVTTETALKAALEAGGNVRLGANIELTQGIAIASSNDLSVVLDLNGYSISEAESGTISQLLILKNESTDKALTFVIQDSSDEKTGKIETECNGGCAVTIIADYDTKTELTLMSGTISGDFALTVMSYAKAIINGGKLTGGDLNDYVTLYLNGQYASAVINYGTVENIENGDAFSLNTGNQKLEIVSGNFAGGIYVQDGATPEITVTGGSFTFDPTEYLPNTTNYQVTKLGENDVWTVSTVGLGE